MTKEELKSIGERIASRRKSLHMTQEQVASAMDVSIQMISNLERGNKAIKIDNLIKISRILGVSTDYILFGLYSDNDKNELCRKTSRLSEFCYNLIGLIIDYCLENQPHDKDGRLSGERGFEDLPHDGTESSLSEQIKALT